MNCKINNMMQNIIIIWQVFEVIINFRIEFDLSYIFDGNKLWLEQ